MQERCPLRRVALVIRSDAPVTTSKALVPSSVAPVTRSLLFLIANIVTTSKALVTSVAPVTTIVRVFPFGSKGETKELQVAVDSTTCVLSISVKLENRSEL